MRSIPVRVAIEDGLQALSAVKEIVQNPARNFTVVVRKREAIIAEPADLLILWLDVDPAWVLDEVSKSCRAAHGPKILVLSTDLSAAYCEEAIMRGASGMIEASAEAFWLRKAIGCIARGELWLGRQTAGKVFGKLSRYLAGRSRRRCPAEAR